MHNSWEYTWACSLISISLSSHLPSPLPSPPPILSPPLPPLLSLPLPSPFSSPLPYSLFPYPTLSPLPSPPSPILSSLPDPFSPPLPSPSGAAILQPTDKDSNLPPLKRYPPEIEKLAEEVIASYDDPEVVLNPYMSPYLASPEMIHGLPPIYLVVSVWVLGKCEGVG